MKRVLAALALIVSSIGVPVVPQSVSAHPGGTDSLGCHTCRTNCPYWGLRYGQYHCHNGVAPSPSPTPSPSIPAPVAPPPPPPPIYRTSAGSITPVPDSALPGATAVLVNLTMVDGLAPGYITADKCSALAPGPQSRSSGNHGIGVAVSNLSVVPVDPDLRLCIYNQVPVNLVADLQGFFAPPAEYGTVFVPVPLTRKLDTRTPWGSRIPSGSITTVTPSAPAGATAVLANITMVDGEGAGYITAEECGELIPGPQSFSNGNHLTGTAVANLSVVPLSGSGTFCVYNSARVNLVVDVQGYFIESSPDGLLFEATSPQQRRLDTRTTPPGFAAEGSITRVNTGVAAGVPAVLVNITMADGQHDGYITADRCSALSPGAQAKTNGNHAVGTAVANLAVVPVDADGSFCIFNQSPVSLVVDLQGTFSSTGTQEFFLIWPERLLDTRRQN